VGGPDLVHVDAYRLGGLEELDDLDLDTSLDTAVTVVEWGAGLAEGLADARLDVVIERSLGTGVAEGELDPRRVSLRWIVGK
jgi:tRNA threonylcarbamoyladenosine biosynthesis protein TsaE